MLPGFLIKTALAGIATKAFDKAGGIEGLKGKGAQMVTTVKTHAGKVGEAIQHQDTGEGAQAIGAIVRDITETAKEAGTATLIIGQEAVADAKEHFTGAVNAIKGPKQESASAKDSYLHPSFSSFLQENNIVTVADLIKFTNNAQENGVLISPDIGHKVYKIVAAAEDSAAPDVSPDDLLQLNLENIIQTEIKKIQTAQNNRSPKANGLNN